MATTSSAFNLADYPVIIGIDFGTTFSGCCYAFAHNENEVIDIVKWPKQNNFVYPKTPTLSLYKHGSTQLVSWGHNARRLALKPTHTDHLLLSRFKLFLDESQKQSELPNNLHVIDVIADYLRALNEHVCEELKKGFASNYDPSKFRYCLTVPAMWSDRAKSAMREAAIRADIVQRHDPLERLMLISEPEAAALYCEKKSEQFNLTHGQRFLICDAGGGTVDLIVFEIDQPAGQRRTLKEVTNGHGGSCGSSFLDENMRVLLKNRLSPCGVINESSMENMMTSFINQIKPEFDGFENMYLDLPASLGLSDDYEEIGISGGQLELTADELREHVFDPVISQVLQLIDDQLVQSPNLEAIFLVGGFGQSNYLFRRVEETFANRVGMIGVPPRGELAVVRGAVYFGLNPKIVTERVSRRTYGVETRMLYQENLDPPEYSVVGVDNKTYCRQRFSVYVQKGQCIKVDECVSKNFVISYPNDTDSDLFAFDGDGTPPRLTTHHLIKKVGHFPIRMPTLEGVRPGDKVNMTIKMYFGLTEIKIECIIQGKVFVFTSAFDATDSYAAQQTPSSQHQQLAHQSYPGAVMNASQASLHNSNASPYQTPMMAQGYPSSSYGGASVPGGAYANDYYAQQPQHHNQQHPQQQQQTYYSGYDSYPPSMSSGYPPQPGYPPQSSQPGYQQSYGGYQ